MYPDYATPLEQHRSKKVLLGLAVGLAILFGVLLVFALRPKEKFDQGWIHKANLTYDQNYTYLQGSTLYAYNGAAFFSTDKSGRTTVLNAKYRLPTPDSIYWANDKGALLTFKASFYSTQIEAEIKNHGGSLAQEKTKEYMWYLDFSTNQIHLVNTAKPSAAYYSTKDNAFYYAVTNGSALELHSYSLDTSKDQQLDTLQNITDVTRLTKCADQKLCFIGRDTYNQDSQRLYGIDQSNNLAQLYDSKGRIFPTNDANKYTVVESVSANNNTDTGDDEADFPDTPAFLYDAINKSKRGLGFKTGISPVTLIFRSSDEFYAFSDQFTTSYNGQDNVPAYEAGRFKGRGEAKIAAMPLLTANGSVLKDKLTSQLSQGGDGFALLSAASQQQYLFDFNQASKDIPVVDQTQATATVDNCIKTAGLVGKDYFEDQKLYRIIFYDTAGFQQKIAKFDMCLENATQPPLIGYQYSFVGIDPKFKRIVTD